MTNSEKYFNRDISWLSFNYRVLEEAYDENLPLYERIKFIAILCISVILFQVPVVNLSNVITEEISNLTSTKLSIPLEGEIDQFSNSTEEMLNTENIMTIGPPEDEIIQFSDSPDISFDIKYFFAQKEIQVTINLRNNLTSSISLLNLWIQVNKSVPDERILIMDTLIIDRSEKLSLSTFDSYQSMIFHLKLYEGEIIAPDEEYEIRLTWYDPDDIFARYDPNLLYNNIADDIEASFEYSTDTEEPQLFPLVEREFYQFRSITFCVDFRITNLMATDLTVFNFTYIKFKDFSSLDSSTISI